MAKSPLEQIVTLLGGRLSAEPEAGSNVLPLVLFDNGEPATGHAHFLLRPGAQLTFGWPDAAARQNPLFARRTFWMPAGLPRAKSVALVSSRLSQVRLELPIVAAAIRTVLAGLRDGRSLLSGSGTTLHRLVRRAVQLFGVNLISVQPMPKSISRVWLNRTRNPAGGLFPVYFAPTDEAKLTTRREVQETIDQIVLETSDEVRALHVRAGGNMEKLLLARLADTSHCGSTFLLMNRELGDDAVKRRLLAAGAIPWWISSPEATPGSVSVTSPSSPLDSGEVRPVKDVSWADLLFHWTRGEKVRTTDDREVLDGFLFGDVNRPTGALRNLCRIVSQQRLRAGGRLIADSRPVVSFTGVSIEEFAHKRRFRPHLARWDFEPFGVAIKSSTLEKLGARPVRYGTAAERSKIPKDEVPFFQVLEPGSSYADWSAEREWRHLGDLDLRAVAIDDAIVFVPDNASAHIVAPLSRWPVVVLGTGE